MRIAQLLAKQTLIAQKNSLQARMLENSARQYNLLQNFSSNPLDLYFTNNMETALSLENITNSSLLMAIDAELGALNSSNLNYFA